MCSQFCIHSNIFHFYYQWWSRLYTKKNPWVMYSTVQTGGVIRPSCCSCEGTSLSSLQTKHTFKAQVFTLAVFTRYLPTTIINCLDLASTLEKSKVYLKYSYTVKYLWLVWQHSTVSKKYVWPFQVIFATLLSLKNIFIKGLSFNIF